ncbi:MAG: methyl-accepting chemotaxis protein [Anaerolineales bacterium]|nr:methyl-accepting chemotaxis protein [Anaerolineales bacterium]
MKLNIRNKLLLGFLAVLVLTGLVGGVGIMSMGRMDALDTFMYENHLIGSNLAQEMRYYIAAIGRDYRHAIIFIDDKEIVNSKLEAIAKWQAGTDENMAQLENLIISEEGRAKWVAAQKSWEALKVELSPVLEEIQAGNVSQVTDKLPALLKQGDLTIAEIDNLAELKSEQAKAASAENTATYTSARLQLIGLIAGAIIVGLGVGFFLARSISNAARQMAGVAQGIARGNLNQTITVKSKDELGDMATAFGQMITYLQDMAAVAGHIASGDLTQEVIPQSEQDALGNAFARMITHLRQLVSDLTRSAHTVGVASSQLAATAEQAGQATSQIATTIQQVSTGVAQQTDGVTRAASSIEQMARTIDSVAKGAQEQAIAVTKSSDITVQMSAAIQQVVANAQAGAKGAAEAAQTAQQGAATVEATVKGMNAIKARVGLSAQKVLQMGQHSDQIGAIIETIDDIASQTNLLALNAAIEAARAGEHGKGFAVVADEVRKLAEKSATATKEIAGLIKGIQQTVAEAVQAMEEGTVEVERGAERAQEAGQSLTAILRAAEAVTRQVAEISEAAEQMSTASNKLVDAMDSVSAVVEENTAATEEMAASSGEMTQVIDHIASVSQENSASVEEVSASTEEMNAQVEEVIASTQSLSQMAQLLLQIVAQFKLSHDDNRTGLHPSAPVHQNGSAPAERTLSHKSVQDYPMPVTNGRH